MAPLWRDRDHIEASKGATRRSTVIVPAKAGNRLACPPYRLSPVRSKSTAPALTSAARSEGIPASRVAAV